jgi:hypothetical protein
MYSSMVHYIHDYDITNAGQMIPGRLLNYRRVSALAIMRRLAVTNRSAVVGARVWTK